MHSKDFHALIQSGARPVVTFRKGAEEGEGYLEAGMRGRITGSLGDRGGDGIFRLTVDLNGFEDFNAAFESANYYNNQGMPVLTAREAGFYPKNGIDHLYVSEDLDPYLEILPDNRTEMHQRYLGARKPNETYVEWLERALLAAERQGLSREESDLLMLELRARNIKLSPGELAYMSSVYDETDGSAPVGLNISFDHTEGRAVGGLEKKGLVIRLRSAVELTDLGAAWMRAEAKSRKGIERHED